MTRKLTLVSAPAGYGKTTLTIEWTESIGVPIAWYSLDESDNDPTRFLYYLIAALGKVNDGVGETASSMLETPGSPPDDLLLTSLINDIASVSQPFILVLDDYHVIHTPAIHKIMAFVLEHAPEQMHLVITTREDPLLPLPRLRGRGQVLEIRQIDLRFSLVETEEFLHDIMGLEINSEDILALESRTEGWIAGLQLAALSMQGRDDLRNFIEAFTGSSRFILDYLIEEVFEKQPADTKDFLLKTAILDRISGSLCDTVTGKTGSQGLLETLEQANLFILPLDQSRAWFRYHRLFSELLRHRLRMSGLNESELHQRASLWFEQNGFMRDAVQHALDGQDWERAGGLIQVLNTDFLKRGEVQTVIGWFRSLPEEILLSNPKLCFDYCWPLLLAGQFEPAAPLLKRSEQMAEDMPEFLGEVYAAQAYLARGLGDHALMVEKSQQALELLPKKSVDSRCIVAMNLGLAYWHMGQMSAAEEVLVEALDSGQATGNHYAALTALIFLGRVSAVCGQLHQAAEYFERAVQQDKGIPVNALAYMDLATLHYEWNALDVSDKHLGSAIDLCQRSQNDEFLVGALMIQSRLRVAQGDLAGAEDALEGTWQLVRSGKIPAPTAERLDVAQARLLMAKGAPAGEWGQKLTEKVDCHPFYRFLGVTRAMVLPDAQARGCLEGLSQVAQRHDWGYGLVVVRALQAARAETREEALELLSEALGKAESSGFIRSFVEAGENLVPLLREAARRGITPDYARRILSVMAKKAELAGAGGASLLEPLSKRELEVLRLVTNGFSNREIAEELVISAGTAKTHVHNLCGKLGVRNRTEAAMRAKELRLV